MNPIYPFRSLLLISLPAVCLLLFSGAGNRTGHFFQPQQTAPNDSIPAYFLSGECGTVVSPEQVAAFDAMQRDIDAFTEEFLEKSGQMAMVTIPIKAHIIRRSNGTGGLTLSAWYAALQNLNTLFQPGNLQFAECGPPNIINSDTYFDFHSSEESELHGTYGVTNVLNVYIPGGQLVTSWAGGVCGYAQVPWLSAPDLMLVSSGCMTPDNNTFAHEVGHYLGLHHTHGISPSCGPITDELVNGSNCNTSGDRVCDTPADPGLRGPNCNILLVDTLCNYTGTLTDANGHFFMPNTRNIMSYSRHHCMDQFSPGQLARMNFYATTPPRSNLVCTPCSNAQTTLTVTSTGFSHISVTWDTLPGNFTYRVRLRSLPNGNWLPGAIRTAPFDTWSLQPCRSYEMQVQVNCGAGFTPYSPIITVQTQGCGYNYCYSYGQSWNHWVAGVNLSDLNTPSGNGYGHSNFTNMQANVEKGQSYPITLTPGTNAASTTVYWRVWIDYNRDGDFLDAGEQVLSITGNSLSPVSGNITVPQNAATGVTRMRVTMSTGGYSTSCATNNATRDVEDYNINIQPPPPPCSAPANLTSLSIGYAHSNFSWNPVPGAVQYEARLRRLPDGAWNESNWFGNTTLLYGLNPCVEYEFQVRADCGNGNLSAYSSSLIVQTRGCGDNYCYSYGRSWLNWITEVSVADLDNPSSNGYGHSDFTDVQINMEKGQSYPITLSPGTNVAATTVFWRVWIDFNGDGDFEDAGEPVLSTIGSSTSPATASIQIPTSAATGPTRMRVSMSVGQFAESCTTRPSNNDLPLDVEDYTVNIQPQVVSHTADPGKVPQQMAVFPNPALDRLTVLLPADVQMLEICDAKGRLLQRIPAPGNAPYQVNASGFPRGLLLLSARDAQGRPWYARVVLQ